MHWCKRKVIWQHWKLSIRFTQEYGECNAEITVITKKSWFYRTHLICITYTSILRSTLHTTLHQQSPVCDLRFRLHDTDTITYLSSYNYCTVLQNCLHPTLWIRKMPTYKVFHSEYFCATMTVLQQIIISGRHGFKASTLHSPRTFKTRRNNTGKNTEQFRSHAFT